MIWLNPRVVTRQAPAGRGAPPPAGTLVARGSTPVLSTQPLREFLAADIAKTFAFGTSPDGTPIGPDYFATTGTVSFTVETAPAAGTILELQADAEISNT